MLHEQRRKLETLLPVTVTEFLERVEAELFDDPELHRVIEHEFGRGSDMYFEFFDRLTDEFIDRIEEIRGGIRKTN